MKKKFLILILSIITTLNYSQDKPKVETEKTLRVNFLNPAVELELPTGQYSTFSSAIGAGYGIGYPDLTYAGNGFIVIISPFVDLQQKWFYNLNKRDRKNKMIANNSGNFVSFRFVTRGNSIASNVYRTSNFDFAIGPTWGLQRTYGKKFHLLFDIGSQYYFDSKGNGNFWPIMLQLNLGFNLEKK